MTITQQRSQPRSVVWAARSAYHHSVLRNYPRVLCNSFHKAGTHLLLGAVKGIPRVRHYGRGVYWHYLARSTASPRRSRTPLVARDALNECFPGEVFRGHVAAHPEIEKTLSSQGFRHVFIYRDPRDTVVSLLHWWKRFPRPAMWPYRYFESLARDEERIEFLIGGWPGIARRGDFPEDVDYPDVGTRFGEFLPWFDNADCMTVRFEDLVDPARAPGSYRTIARHVLPDLDDRLVEELVEGMMRGTDPSRSKTYRSGSSGEWKLLFSKEHVRKFKDCAGDLLVRLGYERDLDW